MNCYALLAEIEQEEIKNCEVGLVGAGICGGFNHNSKLHVMKDKEIIIDLIMKHVNEKSRINTNK